MKNLINHITAVAASEGENVSVVGDTYRIVMSGSQTGGDYALIDMLIPPNGGPGPHAHKYIQETFYVLDGEIEVKTKEKTYTVTKGGCVNIPKGGLVHQFKNVSDEVAHMLCVVTPAGMEDMFKAIGVPVEPGKFLPPPEMTAEKLGKFKAIAEQYGQELFPPDYFG
ncbi:MAG: cupin domain-containing protein [Mucilaginibacter sp.]|uniref:cupin domain-containing protein n=1 Tax=Mucilaginibacter sp. TaxID=1882438 RepID=UPI0032679ADF